MPSDYGLLTLEISVLMAQFPSYEIAKKSYEYRTLGLGYANLGTVLMLMGIPYDSDGRSRSMPRRSTAILTGKSYETSAEMAKASDLSSATNTTRTTCSVLSAITPGRLQRAKQ